MFSFFKKEKVPERDCSTCRELTRIEMEMRMRHVNACVDAQFQTLSKVIRFMDETHEREITRYRQRVDFLEKMLRQANAAKKENA